MKLSSLALLFFLTACAAPRGVTLVNIDQLGEPARARPAPAPLDSGDPLQGLYAGPASPKERLPWLRKLRRSRLEDWKLIREERARAPQTLPELAWTRSAFVETVMPVYDRFLFDPTRRVYTVDRYLDDLFARFGGPDVLVLTAGYPHLGIDERNQFDLWRDLPGGIPAVREVVERIHRRGLKVLLAFHPWDQGTRSEGKTLEEAMIDLLHETRADGIFADNSIAPPRSFVELALKKGAPMALEPEGGLGEAIEAVLWTPMSWAWWKNTGPVPGVDRYRWVDRRFLRHVGAREDVFRLDSLQHAWLNGAGFLAWENFYGTWKGLSPREAEVMRRLGMIYRAIPDFVQSRGWEPHFETLQKGVYASRWPFADPGTVWTLVNLSDQIAQGPQLHVKMRGQRFYNLWTGEELKPKGLQGELNLGKAELSFAIEPHGFAAVLETNELPPVGSGARKLLEQMKERKATVSQFAPERKLVPPKLQEDEPMRGFASPPSGMVRIAPARVFRFRVETIDHEGFLGTGVQYPWEKMPSLVHDHFLKIPAFFLDRHLVTNAEYKKYLEDSEYEPFDRHNFLRDWPNGKLPPELEKKPVNWISIEEARAYCRFYGKRLPREWEWQYAAQGLDERKYPWGNNWEQDRVPIVGFGPIRRPGPDVGAYPRGTSLSGMDDVLGFVWEWTEELYDNHTRVALLKGGSHYQPEGAGWYFATVARESASPGERGKYRLDQHARYPLMAPSLDRSGTIGFRCAANQD